MDNYNENMQSASTVVYNKWMCLGIIENIRLVVTAGLKGGAT